MGKIALFISIKPYNVKERISRQMLTVLYLRAEWFVEGTDQADAVMLALNGTSIVFSLDIQVLSIKGYCRSLLLERNNIIKQEQTLIKSIFEIIYALLLREISEEDQSFSSVLSLQY